ncbi:MAG TPA: DUF5937 family protein [Streptosporangiaceae bacterium]|nr:DUF5937 family protein [Streptosporangiaceae bacterium]
MPTVITGLAEAGRGRPVPVVSPLIEFGSALHVLRDPGHHDRTGWAASTGAKMSRRLAEWTRAWWWTAQAIRAAPFVTAAQLVTAAPPAAPPADDWEASLRRLRAMPASRLASQLLRPVSRSGDVRAARHWAGSREPAVAAVVEGLALRPEKAAAGFVEFLERSWQEWFSAEWAAIAPVLAARARRFADTAAAQGASATLATIDPSVTVTATGSVSIAKVQNARHDVSGRGLLVAPSSLIRPHLYVANVPGHPLLLIHPAEAGPSVPSAADLLRRLDTVAHRGRLEVARAIATEPRTAG